MSEVSTKPYLIRALYEWCTDSGYRPFIAVVVDARTQVPREFVRKGEIVLNICAEATNRLHIGNELLEFEARFGGVARHVSIPIDNVRAIFAQENGHGMAFEVPGQAQGDGAHEAESVDDGSSAPPESGAEAEGEGAEPEGRSVVEAVPGGREAPADRAEAGRAPAKRAAAKRARKTVLREVSGKPPRGEEAAGEAEASKEAGSASGKRPRRPSIAAVPRDAGAGAGEKGRADRPRNPDDDPGPGTPPGKPRLTRVK